MPIYEYRCQSCGKVFEEFLKTAGEAVEPKCPACGQVGAARVFSRFATSSGTDSASFCASNSSCSAGGDAFSSGGCSTCCGGGPHKH